MMRNDFSILTLTSPVTFTNTVKPACLPSDTSANYEGQTAIVTGWGTTSFQGSLSSTLREVDVKVTTNDFCRSKYGNDVSRYVCQFYSLNSSLVTRTKELKIMLILFLLIKNL